MQLFVKYIAILLPLFLQNVRSSVIYKCPGSQIPDLVSDAEENPDEGYELLHFITIHGEAMSHFETNEFRLEPLTTHTCDMSYEVLKINLIGSGDSNMSINFTTFLTPSSSGQFEDNNDTAESSQNKRQDSTLVYEPFFGARNGSESERFMSSTENTITISNTSYTPTESETLQCKRILSRKEVHFTPSGFLYYFGHYYRPSEYCIQSFNQDEESIEIRKCSINCESKNTPCIPLCCHLHEHWDLNIPCCQATLEPKPVFHPVIYSGINRRLSPAKNATSDGLLSHSSQRNLGKDENGIDNDFRPHYVAFEQHKACPDGTFPILFNDDGESIMNIRIHIQNNGKLAYLGGDRKWHFLEKFCVAGISYDENLLDTDYDMDSMSKMNSIIAYCVDESPQETPNPSSWVNVIYIGAFGLSAIFLMLTVIVYLLLWEKQNIHGWTILSFVTSEFFLFLFLSISYSVSVFAKDEEDRVANAVYCLGSAILAHFFFLSTFSWLTIINLDLWWTFKSLKPISERSRGGKRFCIYMLFAWGSPISVVVSGLILQKVYDNVDSLVIVPDYGRKRCFLAHHAEGVYLYYIIGALLLVNIILISCTFYTIYQFKKSTRIASSSCSRTKERSFKLFVKLVVVMGITWTLEFILWLNGPISWLLFSVDLFNIFQAVAIFVIFVCKRKILNQLEQKHPALRVITRPLLRLMASRSSALTTSTDRKPTRSTTVGSSSILQGSRKTIQRSSFVDSKL